MIEPMRHSFMRSELRNMLEAIAATAAHLPDGEFRRGWLAGLNATAVAIGLADPDCAGVRVVTPDLIDTKGR